jgi:peptidyl-prolyl cis-trans isomerase SurA
MRMLLSLAIAISGTANGAVVIDRIAAVVGKHAIKVSDLDRDLRVTDFLNGQPLVESEDAKRKSADRLIDQQIIRDELATGGYERATDADANAMLAQIRQNRYGGSEARLRQALTNYGLNEDSLREQLVWQLTVLKFIDQRFRAGALVTDEEVRGYYDQHPDLRKASFDSVAPKIRDTLQGEQVNKQFEEWLAAARKQARVEFRQTAFEASPQ